MLEYSQVLLDAWNNMVDLFENGFIAFYSEADIRSHLFSCCIGLLEQGDYSLPWQIHADMTIGHRRPDIVLGTNDTALEIKHLRYTYATPTFEDVRKDAGKVVTYVKENSFKHAFLGIVDERGTSKRRMGKLVERCESWREIETDRGKVVFALVEIVP